LIAPAIVTLPVASIVTGELLAFLMNVMVTLLRILIVVKLKTPPGGTCTAWFEVGANGPSAPVDPLTKLCP